MEKNTECYFCEKCKKEFKSENRICPTCGEKSKEIRIFITESITFQGNITGKLKNLLNKFRKNIRYEFFQGWKNSGDKKHPKGIYLLREINRERDEYNEKCIDIATEKIFVDKKEKLSEKHIK